MTLCEQAVEYTKTHEGGFSNHPNDKGGPTNLGVTLSTLRQASAAILGHDFDKDGDGDIDVDDLKRLDNSDLAVIVNKLGYWQPLFDRMPPRVAIKTFDLCFNCGQKSGVKLLQKALSRVINNPTAVFVDGVMGPRTLQSVLSVPVPALLTALVDVSKEHYRAIVEHDPTQKVFINGWIRRAETLPV